MGGPAPKPGKKPDAKPQGGGKSTQAGSRPSQGASKPPQGGSRPPQGASKPPQGGGKRRKKRKLTAGQKFGKVALWSAITLVGLLLIGLVAGLAYYETVKVPDPSANFTTATTTIYYRDGTTQLGQLSVQNRTPLSYADMPETMKDAIVAAEDRTFWTNPGISVTGMMRAAWNVAKGGDLQSGSTITQQYIKTVYLTSAQSVSRKIKELALAIKMTNTTPKQQILERYLNAVYFGRGAYGLQAAAVAYFGIDAKNLTVQQSAVLACLVNGPALYDPASAANIPNLLDRYNYVLDGMVAMGTLSQADAARYEDHLPDFPTIPISQTYGGPNGFLLKMVEKELADEGFSSAEIQGGGLQVITTFDASMQAAAVQSAQQYTLRAAGDARVTQNPDLLHAALASVSVGTGEVLALYDGPDYVNSSWPWAQTPRMTGSTFKPFAFVAGERNGFGLNTMLNGNPFKANDGQMITNDSHETFGRVSLLQATAHSINTAYVDLVQKIPDGPNQVTQAAKDAGVTPPASTDDSWDSGDRIALGYADASPLDMANAYATFANSGVSVSQHVVLQVRDSHGAILYTASPTRQQAIAPGICADLTYALQSVVDDGTGTAVKGLGYPAAGKTGTAGRAAGGIGAAWFVGFTAQISTAVMYVADDPSGDTTKMGADDLNPYAPPGQSTFYGSGYPALTWVDYMKQAMQGLPKVQFGSSASANGGGGEATTEEPSETPTPDESTPADTPTAEPSATPSTPTAAPPATFETPTAPPTTAPPTTAPPTTAAPTTVPPPTAPATAPESAGSATSS